MTHKFKDEIIDWLNGGKYEYQLGSRWEPLDRLQFFDTVVNIRKVDEYKHLREAEERGETIQIISRITGEWRDIKGKPSFHCAVDQYRIKPKTKKIVQWLFKQTSSGHLVLGSTYFEIGFTPNQSTLLVPIKPLPHTEIEVDCE